MAEKPKNYQKVLKKHFQTVDNLGNLRYNRIVQCWTVGYIDKSFVKNDR